MNNNGLLPADTIFYSTEEVNAILARAKRLIGPRTKITVSSLGGFRNEKSLTNAKTGAFIIRAIGSTVPGRGTGKRFWYIEFTSDDFQQLFTDAKLFGKGGR